MSEPLTYKQFDLLTAGVCPDCEGTKWEFITLDGFNFTCCEYNSRFSLDYDLHRRLVISRQE